MADKPLLEVDRGATINQPPPKNVMASASWFIESFNQAILNPGKIREDENRTLHNKSDSDYASFLLEGYQSERHNFKERAWENMDVLPIAEQVGLCIAERIDETVTNAQTDMNITRYLVDGTVSTFFEVQSLGDTVDTGKSLRRARIISMMNAAEKKYVEDGNKLDSEGDWQKFFGSLYSFFDPQRAHGSVNAETEWARTYILYYSAVWNYSEIDFVNPPESDDKIEAKFRGLIGFINNLPLETSEKLFLRMHELDKSTKMKIPFEGKTYLPTPEIIRAAENLYGFNLNK